MRFHIKGLSYQFKALPFGLSTALMEFTVVAEEVKLMALQRGKRIHQYLDNWLVRATSHQTCLQHTQTLVALCWERGWLVNKEKSELDPNQVFNFVGYQFDLREGKVRPTSECWQALQTRFSQYCPFHLEWKGGLSGLKRVQRSLFEQHSSGGHRQHNIGFLYKQRRGDEVGPSVCPSVENPDLV